MTTVLACSGDDNSGPSGDGGPDGSMPEASTMDAPRDNTAPDVHETSTDSPTDVGSDVRDAGPADVRADVRDGAPEAAPDAPADAPGDAPADVRSGDADAMATDAGDAGRDAPAEASPEAAADAGADAAGSAVLNLCPVLDPQWGLADTACPTTTTDMQCGSDRFSAWANDIAFSYLVLGPVTMDCRVSGIFSGLSSQQVNDYLNDLIFWSLQLMGCPDTPFVDAGPYSYGLVPPALMASVFTTADLGVLSEDFAQGIDDAFTNGSASNVTTPPLTVQQESDIRARLAYLASQYPGVVQSSVLTYSSCAPDAGADGGDASSDAPGGG